MAQKISSRLELNERLPLQEVIPLNTPICIQLEVSTICNLRCRFCLHGNANIMEKTSVSKGTFDFQLFKKVIDDLSAFEKPLRSLNLSGVGEPLLNKNLEKMIRYAKDSGYVERVTFISNGTLLTPERSTSIIDAGVDRIDISIYGLSSNDYSRLTQKDIDFETLVKNIAFFHQHKRNAQISVKAFGNVLSAEEQERFYEIFSPITDFVFLQNMGDPFRVNTISDIVGLENINHTEQLVCPLPFYHTFINQNGKVYACCIDYIDNDLQTGDIKVDSLYDIWFSKKLYAIQKVQLQGKRYSIDSCKNCKYLETMSGRDNIDPYRKQLLQQFEKNTLHTIYSPNVQEVRL